jgi:hypothetical protein
VLTSSYYEAFLRTVDQSISKSLIYRISRHFHRFAGATIVWRTQGSCRLTDSNKQLKANQGNFSLVGVGLVAGRISQNFEDPRCGFEEFLASSKGGL